MFDEIRLIHNPMSGQWMVRLPYPEVGKSTMYWMVDISNGKVRGFDSVADACRAVMEFYGQA